MATASPKSYSNRRPAGWHLSHSEWSTRVAHAKSRNRYHPDRDPCHPCFFIGVLGISDTMFAE